MKSPGKLTVVPWFQNLEGVDHLGIESRRQLDAHTCREEHEVEEPKVGLLVPWDRVLSCEARDDGVGKPNVRRTCTTHLVEILLMPVRGVRVCQRVGGWVGKSKRAKAKAQKSGAGTGTSINCTEEP